MPSPPDLRGSHVQAGHHTVFVHVDSVLRHLSGSQLRLLPNACGAYVIVGESGRRYVGSSNTARSRVQAHRVKNDPNLREPIASVCCSLTKQHMDARILEYWLIREIGPELNRSRPSGMAPAGTRCRDCCAAIASPGKTLRIDVRVTGATENVPASELSTLPTGPGAYVLTTRSGKRYVGSSTSLRGRIRTHVEAPQHPNLDGPVEYASCYTTETEADAPLLEYALIRDLEPELNRENQPDASEWKDGERDALVASAHEALASLQAELGRRIVRDVGGKEVFRKSWVTYQLSAMKNFCAVKVLADCLQVDLKIDARELDDAAGFSEPLTPTQAWTFNRRVRVRSVADIDRALPLIAQAQRFLAR